MRELSDLYLVTSPLCAFSGFITWVRDRFLISACQETIDMHTFNYESIGFCGLLCLHLYSSCSSQEKMLCSPPHLLCSVLFSDIFLEKPFIFVSAQPVTMQLSVGWSLDLLAGSVNINAKLFSLYLCSGLFHCKICQPNINKYVSCAS